MYTFGYLHLRTFAPLDICTFVRFGRLHLSMHFGGIFSLVFCHFVVNFRPWPDMIWVAVMKASWRPKGQNLFLRWIFSPVLFSLFVQLFLASKGFLKTRLKIDVRLRDFYWLGARMVKKAVRGCVIRGNLCAAKLKRRRVQRATRTVDYHSWLLA